MGREQVSDLIDDLVMKAKGANLLKKVLLYIVLFFVIPVSMYHEDKGRFCIHILSLISVVCSIAVLIIRAIGVGLL